MRRHCQCGNIRMVTVPYDVFFCFYIFAELGFSAVQTGTGRSREDDKLLKKLKEKLFSLLGAADRASEKKSVIAVPAENGGRGKGKRRPSEQEQGRRRSGGGGRSAVQHQERPSANRRRRGGGRSVPEHEMSPAQVASPEKKPVPPCPEKLEDVPPEEGKVRFLDFPIHEKIQFGIQNAGFKYCTPIQAMTMPHLLEGRDLAGKAQTGTGKTAAFLITLFTALLDKPVTRERAAGECRSVVLSPTRELAMQIYKDAVELGVYSGLNIELVFGGMDYDKQKKSLGQPVDVLIGTPGRVIDYLRRGCLSFKHAEVLVIDEADRMLDMGFIPDVRRIVSALPPKGQRQTLLFSATLEDKILRLCSGWLAEPITVESEPERLVGDTIEQRFYTVSRDEKLAMTIHLLNEYSGSRVMIFGNRKDVNIRLQYDLAKYGLDVPLLSGDISQEKRIRILERFRSGQNKMLIATDVAARGIHVDDVGLVINYDLPEQPEDYVHRIGRTGRAGKSGRSVSFICEYGAYNLPGIEKLLGVEFKSVMPDDSMVELPPMVKNPKLPKLEERLRSFSRRSPVAPRARRSAGGRHR